MCEGCQPHTLTKNKINNFSYLAANRLNTIRLWLPQLFTMISNFESTNNVPVDQTAMLTDDIFDDYYNSNNLCSMIAQSVNKSATNIKSIETNGTCTIPV